MALPTLAKLESSSLHNVKTSTDYIGTPGMYGTPSRFPSIEERIDMVNSYVILQYPYQDRLVTEQLKKYNADTYTALATLQRSVVDAYTQYQSGTQNRKELADQVTELIFKLSPTDLDWMAAWKNNRELGWNTEVDIKKHYNDISNKLETLISDFVSTIYRTMMQDGEMQRP